MLHDMVQMAREALFLLVRELEPRQQRHVFDFLLAQFHVSSPMRTINVRIAQTIEEL